MNEEGLLKERVALIRKNMEEAASKRGIPPGKLTLCAACKAQDPERIRLASILDIDAFGENRVQELKRNLEAGAYGGRPVHFIGHLQTNKVKDVVGQVELIQSVDSLRLLEHISHRAEELKIVQRVLIEVNIASEETKSGLLPGEASSFFASAGRCPGVRVEGMMAIPPRNAGESGYFESLYQLFIDIKEKKYDNVHMQYLSMGMSGDYMAALTAGANMVRIGSSIFGPRA